MEEEPNLNNETPSFETSFEKLDPKMLNVPNFDPQDAFLRDCTDSIILSISSLKSKTSLANSDFSIISNPENIQNC